MVLAALLALPVVVLAVEVAASVVAKKRLRRRPPPPALSADRVRPSVAVVVPAHNEEATLPGTLTALWQQLDASQGDRVLVVADNCDDTTADVARGCGVECLERDDRTRVGKGFALDTGVRHLFAGGRAPDVVILNDADVVARPGAIAALARQVVETERPAQGSYLMSLPPRRRNSDLVSRFALVLKNHVRPLGLWQLGLPCPLFGSGMAFPGSLARWMPLASGDLVEDMRLGLDLCRAGRHPLYCPDAIFEGELPADDRDATTQRRRWEHGHMAVLLATPGMFVRGLVRRDYRLVAAALDHSVQPLTVLCGGLLLVVLLTVVRLAAFGGVGPVAVVAASLAASALVLMVLSLAVTWLFHLRRDVPPAVLLGLPTYLLKRIPNQAAFLFRRQKTWVRTPRPHEHAGPPATRPLPAESTR